MRTVRTVDLETTGSRPPAHAVCEIGWQDVVERPDGKWELSATYGATLVDPGRDIPAVTQAVHHIVDADVFGAPRWDDVAPGVLRGDFIALAAHRASFEQNFCTPKWTAGAAWICTYKCALRLFPDSPGFSNQMLRYWRRPEGLRRERGLPVHRALPDAYVTAHHLRDMLNMAGPAQLIAWSALPGLLPRVRWGDDRGAHFEELSTDRLVQMTRDRDEDLRFTAAHHLALRGEGEDPARRPPPPQPELF